MEKPEGSGVYLMKDVHNNVLYIGKALNLKARVGQYLHLHDSRSFIPRMLKELRSIEFILTGTEKEALLLEAQLIRKMKPHYNVRLQDDKNFLLVRIDQRQPYPRFELVRQRKRDGASYFGPYPSAASVREFIRFLSRAHRIRVCRDAVFSQRQRPCMLHGMGWCSAPCSLPQENADYAQRVKDAVEALRHQHGEAQQLIEQRMMLAAEEERFEEAARYRDLLRSLRSLWSKPLVRLDTPLDADVVALYQGPLGGAVYVLMLRDSQVVGTRSLFDESLCLPTVPDLESILFQFYVDHDLPDTLLVPMPQEEVASLKAALGEAHGRSITIEAPLRGRKKALLEMAVRNAQQVYETQSRNATSSRQLLETLAQVMELDDAPEIVECVDISAFQGSDAVGSISVAHDGKPVPAEYRAFHIKGSTTDDFTMMAEVVRRRIKMWESSPRPPDLLILDGGRPQLRAIEPIFEELGVQVALGALAKARPNQGLPVDRLFMAGREEPLPLEPSSQTMHFLMHLRDEAHRFGVAFHRKKREKRTMKSPLLEIPGVGAKRRMDLIRHFGSFQAVSQATLGQLQAVRGLPLETAKAIRRFFHPDEEEANT